jgi:thiopeptide-type bacteriocin biosynthesis protein
VLRPGASLALEGGAVSSGPEQTWPYAAPRWTQIDVALDRSKRSAHASARLVFAALEPFVASARAEGRLQGFFFMRKPPDLRLRFLGDRALREEALAVLSGLGESAIDRMFTSVYEPETERFGGKEAMEAVHAWFDVDTSLWLAADRLTESSAAQVPQHSWCAAIAGDLVLRTLNDRLEAWAVWKAHAEVLAPRVEAASAPSDMQRISLATIGPLATAEERRLLERYAAVNADLAAALIGARSEGKLLRGLREVIGAVVIFHFHRYGLSADAQVSIATTMAAALSSA